MIPDIYGWLVNDSAVSSMVGTSVYPNVVPLGKDYPAIVYQTLPLGGPSNYLAETPGADRVIFQATAWSQSMVLARDIAVAMNAVFEQHGHVISGPMMDFDPDMKVHGVRLDVSVWGLR